MRFILQNTVLSAAILWASFVLFGPLGLVGASFCLLLMFIPRPPMTLVESIVVAGIIAILATLALPTVQTGSSNAQRDGCRRNLKWIGAALQEYHAAHGCFPPAYVSDADGRPMHSWRVLLLPYLNETALHDKYDFNESWDGPNNQELAAERPDVYACPSHRRTGDPTETSYLAVVDPKTVWSPGNEIRRTDITDGPTDTLAVVEATEPGIHWMQPMDLSLRHAKTGINAGPDISASHRYNAWPKMTRGVNVLYADGTVRSLADDLSGDVIEALLTRSGKEPLDAEEFDCYTIMIRERDWQFLQWRVAMVVLVVSVVLLLRFGRRTPKMHAGAS